MSSSRRGMFLPTLVMHGLAAFKDTNIGYRMKKRSVFIWQDVSTSINLFTTIMCPL